MTQEVDRNKVLQTIRVRSAIKKDGSWIQGTNDGKKEEDTAGYSRTSHAVETKPGPIRSSHVRSAAKRFETIDPSPSSPPQKAEVIPSEGDIGAEYKLQPKDSVNQASGDITPALKDAQPTGSTVETKPQAPTQEPIQNFKAQPEKAFTDATAENTEQHADAPADTCHNEGEASADADVKNPAVEIAAVEGTVRESSESKSTAGVPGECLIKREPASATNLEHAGVNLREPPTVATSGKEASLHGSVETPTVNGATPKKEASVQNSVVSVADTLPKPSGQPDADAVKSAESKVKSAESKVKSAESKVESAESKVKSAESKVKSAESKVESAESKVESAESKVKSAESKVKSAESKVESAESKVESAESKVKSAESKVKSAESKVKSAESKVESAESKVKSAESKVKSAESQVESAESKVESAESKVKSAQTSEPVFKTRTDEVAERKADNTVVKESFDSTPKTAGDHVKELNIDDALEHVAASDAKGVQDDTVHTAVRLTDALDVETPTAEGVPKPAEEPKQAHSEKSKPKQKCGDTAEVFQKPAAQNKSSGKSVCYFCNQIFNGTVKIIFSEPPMSCHPECLKCGVCARALGDMLTPMFLKDQVIQCKGCFSRVAKK